MKHIQFNGYLIYSNGNIFSPLGKKLADNNRVRLKIDGKYQNFSKKRLLYYVFNQNTFDINDLSKVVTLKSNRNKKVTLENLIVTDMGYVLHGDRHGSSKLTNKQVKDIINTYNKYSKQDNDLDKNSPNRRMSYRKLAEKYGVSHNLIKGIIKGEFRNKDNYIIKEEKK